MLSKINSNTNVLEFYDAPIFAQDILTINYEIDHPIAKSRPTKNDAQFLDVNEIAEDDEVFYHAFMEKEGIESNEFEVDDSGWIKSTDSEDSKESNEDDTDGALLMSDDEEVPIERTHLSRLM